MRKNSKKIIAIGSVLLVLIGVIGLTYAYFAVGGTQEDLNSFTSGCFSISLENESDSISLDLAEPITDMEGLKGDAYTFTVRNNCNEDATYVVNLESLNENETSLAEEFVKVSLSSDTMDNVISILANNQEVTPEIEGAYESHNLYIGTLGPNEEKSFELKLWLDYDATVEAANKTFLSKVNVIATTNVEDPELPEATFALNNGNLEGTPTGEVTEALYCLSSDQVCTPTEQAQISDGKIVVEWPIIQEEQFACVQITNANGSRVICSNAYSDINPPSDPLMAFNDNYDVVLSGSVDDQSEVTYYYSLDGIDYTEGNTISLASTSTVYAYAADASGNRSNIIQRTVTINDAQNDTPDDKFYCSYTGQHYDTQSEATNACRQTVDNSYTGSTRYYCSHNGAYQTSPTCSQSSTYQGTPVYYCDTSGTYQSSSSCSYTTNATSRTTYTCPDGSTSSSSSCSATFSTTHHYTVPCSGGTSASYGFVTTSTTYPSSCSSSSGTCSSSSHVGNTRVTCAGPTYSCSTGTLNGSVCNVSTIIRSYTGSNASTQCQNNCSYACLSVSSTRYDCVTVRQVAATRTYTRRVQTCRQTSSGSSGTYGTPEFVNTTQTNGGACPSGYTRTGTSDGNNTCTSITGSCSSSSSCTRSWTAYCSATATANTTYSCSSGTLSGSRCYHYYTGDRYYRCGNRYQTGSTCSSTSTYTGSTRYYCSHNGTYQTSSLCENTSTTNHDTANRFYCSITNQYYNTENEAQAACTNVCSRGDYHNNRCYQMS